jgi:ELWxxDGT repeat protein
VSGASANPNHFEVLDNKLYYSGNDATSGQELWVYDPAIAASTTNPKMIYDLEAGSTGSLPAYLRSHNGKLYFSADVSVSGRELYEFDPSTAAGATNPQVMELASGSLDSNPISFVSLGHYLYFGYQDSAGSGEKQFATFNDSQAFSLGTNPVNHSMTFDNTIFDMIGLTISETITSQ